jgi:hypothetical protein
MSLSVSCSDVGWVVTQQLRVEQSWVKTQPTRCRAGRNALLENRLRLKVDRGRQERQLVKRLFRMPESVRSDVGWVVTQQMRAEHSWVKTQPTRAPQPQEILAVSLGFGSDVATVLTHQ